MSVYTNIHNLPAAIVAAVQADPYQGGGDISCTRLIDAPQIRVLCSKHKDDISVDVSERVWSLLGQSVHTILERAGLKDGSALVEERLYATICGWTVSGQPDVLSVADRKLSDFKVTTTYKQHGSDSWTRQLNVLRWLAHKNGHRVDTLSVVAIFRDWRKTEAQRNPDYPQAAIQEIAVPVWSLEETEEYITERVYVHQAASRGEDVPCSDEDRWFSGNTYALTKHGASRATKVASDPAALGPYNPETHEIVVRAGEYKRCLHYCDARAFCQQWGGGKGG